MTRARLPLLALTPLLILVGSCVGNDNPTGVGGSELRFDIRVSPALVPSAADAAAAPINRIRARVARIPDNVVLGETVVDVSPSDEEWEVMLEATVTGESTEATLFVYLINASDDVESVEFSGLIGPITLVAGEAFDAPDIPIIRGPIENSFVTGITVTSTPDTLLEGNTATLEADVSTSAEVQPTVFWTVLDSAVLSAADADVTALAPGLGRVVASAGAFADTASIFVIPAPANIVVSPATASVLGVGAQATYQAVVLDARGDTLTGETVTWRSATPSIITSLGDGLFEAVSIGGGIVEAVSDADPAVVGTAAMVVGGAPADVAVTKAASVGTAQPGDTIDFEIVVTNESQDVLVGIRVADTIPADLTVESTTPAGTPMGSTWTWALDTLVSGAADTITVRASVDLGASDGTRTNVVTVAPPVGFADPDATDDRADVSFEVTGTIVQAVDVVALKTVDEPQPLEDSTVVFTVSVVNNGPIAVSNVAVFDTLESVFLAPAHVLSTGMLAGDSLWTIPTLAVGDTATWTTTATVATGVAGGSASNTAFVRSLTENDSTPANDTAVVVVGFPVSAVPVVQITAPAAGSVFDPGDLVTFSGTANDAEEGDLGASIAWVSDLDGALATGPNFGTNQLTTGVHLITATVTDQDAGTGADSIQVTIALITTPATLNVPFGGTASLPISLSEPAPQGGFTLTVTSGDPAVTMPTAGTVFIPGGALSANATLQGLQPGTVNVTASNPQFGSSVTSVSVTAELDILVTNLTVPQTFPQPVAIQLESLGVPIAAPAGGLLVTLTSLDPTCVTAPATVTIPAGLIQETATLSYGGSAQLSCTAYVRASATSVIPDSVNVTVTPPPSLNVNPLSVGAGLQYGTHYATLGATAHGGTTVRLESADPATLLVAPDGTTPGSPFIDVFVQNGQNLAPFYLQGVEGQTGTPSLTATAPGFSPDSALITVVQAAYDVVGLNLTTTSFSPDDAFYVRAGVPNGQNTALAINQAVRAGGQTLTATLTSSAPVVGDLVTLPDSASPVTVEIAPLAFSSPTSVAAGGVALEPIAAGNTTVTASIPSLVATDNAVRGVAVTSPVLSVSPLTVGGGLQYGTHYVSLGATAHGGVTVRVESGVPGVMLVAPDAATPGTPFVDVFVPDGQNLAPYFVQGVEGQTGVVPLIATAPGFTGASSNVTVVTPAHDIVGLNLSTTTFTTDDAFYVRIGVPNGQQTALAINQAVRAGGQTLTATISSSDPLVADLITLPDSASPVTLTIAPGQFNTPTSVAGGGSALEPIGAGTATVSAVIPGFIASDNATRVVTVTAPTITLSNTTVGSGLQYGAFGASLGATGHGGVTVRIESSDPSTMLVSPDASTAGTTFIDVAVPNGQNFANYWVHGLENVTGVVPLTAAAPGFTSGSANITVVQPGYDISGLTTSPSTFSADDPFTVRVGLANGQLTGLTILQSVRTGGTTATATVTSSNTGVGILRTQTASGASVTASVVPGTLSTPASVALGGIEFDPLGIGTTTVSASIPGSFLATDNASQSVTVSAPAITASPVTVGSGLQSGIHYAVLGATQHGGVTVRMTSSNPSVFLVAPDAVTEATPFIDVVVPNGQNFVGYYVAGVEGATGAASMTVTAPGFTDGTTTKTVVQPGLDFVSLSTSYSAAGADDVFWARLGIPTANDTDIGVQQSIRFGGDPITVTLTSSNVGAAQLVTSAQSGGSVQLTILPGTANTGTSVAADGVAIDPAAAGSTVIEVTAPGVITTADGTKTVTINP